MRTKKKLYPTLYSVSLVLCLAIVGLIFFSNGRAAPVVGFDAGRIIDDSIFTNSNSMSTSQIQNFLNSKVPACDTWGEQASEFGGGTRRQWAEARGYSPPYTCLRDYSENGKTAARIIKDTASQFQINPQVLIVLLQKEQGLVTDTWPLSVQYRTATGYGCPDTAPCDSQYYGLTNQLTWAARMFRAIMNNSPTWYTPYVLGNNSIRWNPSASCGSSTVNIQNRATQALYNYTPYRPNQAALNAGYGTGDSCSSYGNRNFYLYFKDWFGSTKQVNMPGCSPATNTDRVCIWKLSTPTGKPNFTPINDERDKLVRNYNYQYQGLAFLGNITKRQGNIPIYRLTKPDGNTFLTRNKSEYDTLKASGYTDKGIAFYADPVNANSGYPVYRLYSSSTGIHTWTLDSKERQTLLDAGYVSEGIAFHSISGFRQETAPATGKQLVYRFGSMPGNSHFWTTNLRERDSMISRGYRYEGVAWQSSTTTTNTPIYRLYSPTMQKHLFTKDRHEKDVLSRTSSWNYEGIAYYTSDQSTSKPIYRLYSPITLNHFLTASNHERQVLVANGTFRYEGIAWYAY